MGLAASGFKRKHQQHLEDFLAQPKESGSDSEEECGDDEGEEGQGLQGTAGEQCATGSSSRGVENGSEQPGCAARSHQDAAADTQGDGEPGSSDSERLRGSREATASDGEGNGISERQLLGESSSSEGSESESGSESSGERELKEKLHRRRDMLQAKKLEGLAQRMANTGVQVRLSLACFFVAFL